MENSRELAVLYLVFICWTCFRGSSASSCKALRKPKKQTIQVCHKMSVTSDNVYIDSDGAPEGDVACNCTVERADNLSKSLPFTVVFHVSNYVQPGMVFELNGHEYSNTSKKHAGGVLNSRKIVSFRKRKENNQTAICFALIAGGYGAEIKVACYGYKSQVPSEEDLEWVSTSSTQDSTEDNSLTTVLIVASVAGVVLVVAGAIVTLVCTRRAKRSQDIVERQAEPLPPSDQPGCHPAENVEYASVKKGPQNEMPRELQANDATGSENAYAAIEDPARTTSDKLTRETTSNNLGDDSCATDTVYDTAGSAVGGTAAAENVYNTFAVESEYNRLNEVVSPKILSDNVYGVASVAPSNIKH